MVRTCLKDYLSSLRPIAPPNPLRPLHDHSPSHPLGFFMVLGFLLLVCICYCLLNDFQVIICIERTSQQSEKSSRRDGWVKYSRNYRISTKWSFGRHNDPTKRANPWNLWLSYLASQKGLCRYDKLRILRWGYHSGLSGLTQNNHKRLDKRGMQESQSQGRG